MNIIEDVDSDEFVDLLSSNVLLILSVYFFHFHIGVLSQFNASKIFFANNMVSFSLCNISSRDHFLLWHNII